MKKLFLFASAAALIFSSCTQELPVVDEISLQEVTFASASDDGGFKSDPFDCSNPVADYALVYLSLDGETLPGSPMEVPVFYVNDIMYTQAIKLSPEVYTVDRFELYAEGANEDGSDMLVNAVPNTQSTYGNLVSSALPLDITVSSFTKTEVPLSILCYEPATHDDFGFTWFRVVENSVRNKFFFGDFCTKFFEDYDDENSLYGGTDVVKVDMPAIFKLDLYYDNDESGDFDGTELVQSFDNEALFNNAAPLEIVYPDMDGDGDLFKVDISIYVKIGDGFGYESFGSWYWKDGSDLMFKSLDDMTNPALGFTSGQDGVYDFILGNCNVNGADIAFAPYMNIPKTGTLTVGSEYAPSTTGAYLDVKLTNIGTGYDFEENVWLGTYCFEKGVSINLNTTYTVDVYSSLYPANMPAHMSDKEWDRLNWLANNLDLFPDYLWSDFQHAIWTLEDPSWNGAAGNGLPAKTSVADDMVAAAVANGDGYNPMPGGWAAVSFDNDGTRIQTVFIIVDP